MKMLEKSTPPVTTPIGGMMMSSTSDLTMVEKAAPMMTPTAMSMTLPRSANSLNSFSIAAVPRKTFRALSAGSLQLAMFGRQSKPVPVTALPVCNGRLNWYLVGGAPLLEGGSYGVGTARTRSSPLEDASPCHFHSSCRVRFRPCGRGVRAATRRDRLLALPAWLLSPGAGAPDRHGRARLL